MTKPAIIFVIMQTPASANGGIESITEVMRRLRRHRPVVLTNRASERSGMWQAMGIETHFIPEFVSSGWKKRPLAYLTTHLRYHRAVKRLIRETGARIVHANDLQAFQLALSAVKSSRGRRIAMNLRDTLDPGRKPPRRRYGAFFRASDHMFFLSQDNAAWWTRVAPEASRSFTVTYSIVDRDRFAPTPPPVSGRPVVLVSGVFRPKKGQLDFLRHAAPVLVAGGAEIWLAGDFDPASDPYSAACAEAAEPLGDAVRFLGYRTDLPDLIAKATAIAVPSRYEGLVRVMIEALSCGRPVVSFDVSSAREILEDKAKGAGVVVELGDFAGLAHAALAYCRDPAAAAQAGRIGAEAARTLFDAERVAERYENAYCALVA